MADRFEKTSAHEIGSHLGPVITISRVGGCSATVIAEALTVKINQLLSSSKSDTAWNWVNKQILSMASHELKMHPDKVKQLVESAEKGMIDEIVDSFTENDYAHSNKVKSVIEEVIRSIAVKGNVVIVGRAGAIIAADIPNSLHVNLEAPLSWRIDVISKKRNLSKQAAEDYILQMDKKRETFKKQYKNKFSEMPDYDISINCKSHSIDQICDLIIKDAQLKKLL